MHVEELLAQRRDGVVQDDEAIGAFVRGAVEGTWSRPQIAAWLAWAFAHPLTPDETVALTDAMTHSGDVLSWGRGTWDKHSTGGVGDKASLVLAPVWAALGRPVPMISGRGLGHTGGTLDKLESIDGYRTDLDADALRDQLDDVGCFITGQTRALAPADRILYALRDEIGAIASRPLIVASILSKKRAAGVGHLVMDVKVGEGAFMRTDADATALAEALVAVGTASGMTTEAFLTDMDRPLGAAIGNAVEVAEAVACLKGEGPADLRALVVALARHDDAARVLDDGTALEAFRRMVRAQGGDPRVVDDPTRLRGGGVEEVPVRAPRAGVVHRLDALACGRAAFRLGAGRARAGEPVDPGVGLIVRAPPGTPVSAGDAVVTVLHRGGRGLDEAVAGISAGIVVEDTPLTPPPLVRAHVPSA